MSKTKIRGGIVEGAPWLRWQCVDGIVTFGPAQPAAPDAAAGDGLRPGDVVIHADRLWQYDPHGDALYPWTNVSGRWDRWPPDHIPPGARLVERDGAILPALRDVLAAAARDAARVATLEAQCAALQRFVMDLTMGLNRELASTRRVRELHAADDTEPHACTECGEAMPCCTTEALDPS